jgi:DNA relaxase NicK
MSDISFGIHWLSFTVHAPRKEAFIIYENIFRERFGDLEELGHGGRGFKEIFHTLLEFKIYLTPAYKTEDEYFHFEIPGRACELIPWHYLKVLEFYLPPNYKDGYSYTRIDLAFDNLSFTPQQVEQAIREEKIRSLAKRESLEVHQSPFVIKDDGGIGTYTVELGSRTSERMVRVYDRRGFTRLELELKDRRADLVAKELFRADDISEWYSIMISHLRDFVDFDTLWWEEFVKSTGRAWAKVSNPKDIELEKIISWFEHQIAPALSVLVDTQTNIRMQELIDRGRKHRGSRYNLILGEKKQE